MKTETITETKLRRNTGNRAGHAEHARGVEKIAAATGGRYFLPYQKAAIMSPARLEVWEKSVRIGATYAHAFRAVRRRQEGNHGDLLHTSVNERIAKDFITDCKRFCRIFDFAGASDVNEFDVWNESEQRRETAFEIIFSPTRKSAALDHPVAIRAFSSNPDAIRGAGGEVNVDELASHKRAEEILKAAGGRAMWGYDMRIWSSHKGDGSCFNRLIKEQRSLGEAARWKVVRTTLPDALEAGLLDKINETRKTNISREDFIADTVALVGGQEAFDEECLCNPRTGGDAAVAWQWIDAAKERYDIHRKHVEGDEAFDVEAWGADLIALLRSAQRVAIGYDVARTGHLSAIAFLALQGGKWWPHGLITTHKRKFGLQREIIARAMRAIPGSLGAGDKTGLGMQICEELAQEFGESRFVGMNFFTLKPDLGTKLTGVFQDGRIVLPAAREHEDIGFDIHGISKEVLPSTRIRFYETANPVNKLSHCDIAWAIAMALLVGDETGAHSGIYTWASLQNAA